MVILSATLKKTQAIKFKRLLIQKDSKKLKDSDIYCIVSYGIRKRNIHCNQAKDSVPTSG